MAVIVSSNDYIDCFNAFNILYFRGYRSHRGMSCTLEIDLMPEIINIPAYKLYCNKHCLRLVYVRRQLLAMVVSEEETYQLKSAVRGHYVIKLTWRPVICQHLAFTTFNLNLTEKLICWAMAAFAIAQGMRHVV